MQMYRRKEGKKKVKIGAHKGLILTLPLHVNLHVKLWTNICMAYMPYFSGAILGFFLGQLLQNSGTLTGTF